jgi:signal transduction histidine kinase
LPDELIATVDPVRVEQVITNLLDNAARYCPSGAPVTVTLTQRGTTELRLTVADQGPGIPPEHRHRIFDRFYQASSGQHATGMGLGLFICRQIVEQHDGTIAVECPKEGGARFIVTLPLAPAMVWPATARP